MTTTTKIFISYHHLREQEYKDKLSELFKKHESVYFPFKDKSVGIGDIDPSLEDKKIFQIIRENFLKDTEVIIVILGEHTKCRKHVDWEIASSLMNYGSLDRKKKNGLIILLTDDFIEKEKKNSVVFDGKNYSSLINEQNSLVRIYENAINNYAIVESFSNVYSDLNKLKNLIYRSQNNCKSVIPENELELKKNNDEQCPEKSNGNDMVELANNDKEKYWNLKNIFNYLPCYSKECSSEQLNFEEIKVEVNNMVPKKKTISDRIIDAVTECLSCL